MLNLISFLFVFLNLNLFNAEEVNLFECDFSDVADAVSAFGRAQSQQCKNEIKFLSCVSKQQKTAYLKKQDPNNNNIFLKPSLKRLCSDAYDFNLNDYNDDDELEKDAKIFQGCLLKTSLFLNESSRNKSNVKFNPDVNDLKICISFCLTNYANEFAGFDHARRECFCMKSFNSSLFTNCETVRDEEFVKVYRTGLSELIKPNVEYKCLSQMVIKETYDRLKKLNSLPRIVFLFTINGRSIRQVTRLLKHLYDDLHFYYFHVDERMTYLKNELIKLETSLGLRNFRVSRWSMPTIWGGASLLQMHLKVMQELDQLKQNQTWNWDFLINLSESDFPIKSVQDLTLYLSKNGKKNFLKFISMEFGEYSKRQALEKLFLQCENRMWRVAEKKFPIGLQFSGASDWFCLNHEFVAYVLNSEHDYLKNLKIFFNYTLLPSESFFQTVILNSPHCHNYVNSNLRFVNWIRSRGCQCQYKHIVDWCGCSPNLFTVDDWSTFKKLHSEPLFIARKFDPLFGQDLINMLDQSTYGLYSSDFKSLNSFWENVYNSDADKQISLKSRVLFHYFLNQTYEALLERLENLDELISLKLKNKVLNNVFFNLKNVNSFFEANRFVGFVVNLNLLSENFSLNCESLIAPVGKNEIIEVFMNENPMAKLFLTALIQIQVSTNYDAKERRFADYASLLDLKSNPALLMKFDPINQSLNFNILWTNPRGQLVKESRIFLNSSDTSQLVLNSFFKLSTQSDNLETSLNVSGIWSVQIEFISDGDMNSTLLKIKFLVLPTENVFELDDSKESEMWKGYLKQFWKFKKVCLENLEDLKLERSFLVDNLFENCKTQSQWSSFYPDPKSDFMTNNYVDMKQRII